MLLYMDAPPSDHVDEELQGGEVGAQQVGHKHGRHNDGVPYKNSEKCHKNL